MSGIKQNARIAMYGGSFNPIHNGHLQLAELFICELKLDMCLLMPTASPPHKSSAEIVSSYHRVNMCNLATANIEKCEVSTIEIERDGKSYTIDTLRRLKQEYPNSELFLLMGADMFLSLDTWKKYREILSLATVCAIPRNENSSMELIKYAEFLNTLGGKTFILNRSVMQVSSSQIRKAVKGNNSISSLVPTAVIEYIDENKLYRK